MPIPKNPILFLKGWSGFIIYSVHRIRWPQFLPRTHSWFRNVLILDAELSHEFARIFDHLNMLAGFCWYKLASSVWHGWIPVRIQSSHPILWLQRPTWSKCYIGQQVSTGFATFQCLRICCCSDWWEGEWNKGHRSSGEFENEELPIHRN